MEDKETGGEKRKTIPTQCGCHISFESLHRELGSPSEWLIM